SRPCDEQARYDACRAASLAYRGACHEGQRRLPLEKAAASRADAQKKSLRAAEQDRADIAEAREEWRSSQPDLNPERLVFLDETGANKYGQALWPGAPWSTPFRACALRPLDDDNIRCRLASR